MSDSWWEAGATGIGDALGYEPVLLILKAPLRMAQRRFPEAIKLLDQAVALYLEGQPEHRDPHLAGRSLISKSAVLIEMGESESAIQTLKRRRPDLPEAIRACHLHPPPRRNLSKMGTRGAAGSSRSCGSWLSARGAWTPPPARVRAAWQPAGRHGGPPATHGVRQLPRGRESLRAPSPPSTGVHILGGEHRGAAPGRRMVAVFRAHNVPREALAAVLLFRKPPREAPPPRGPRVAALQPSAWRRAADDIDAPGAAPMTRRATLIDPETIRTHGFSCSRAVETKRQLEGSTVLHHGRSRRRRWVPLEGRCNLQPREIKPVSHGSEMRSPPGSFARASPRRQRVDMNAERCLL